MLVRTWSRWGLLALGALACACGRQDQTAAGVRFGAKTVVPAAAHPGAEAVVSLNREIVVWFTRTIDPTSVSHESFRMLDEAGRVVEGLPPRIGTHSITFVPKPPLRPALDDGTLVPGRHYVLEVVGYPALGTAVRARDGEPLERTVRWRFRAVTQAEAASGGGPPLLLPEGTDRPFRLRQELLGLESLSLETGELRLHFTRPLDPRFVHRQAFRFFVLPSGGGFREVEPREVRLESSPAPIDRHPGCTVSIRLDPASLGVELPLYVVLAEPPKGVVDYGGEPPEDAGRPFQVPVRPLRAVRLVHETFLHDPFVPAPGVGFEVRSGRAWPRVRREAGTGRLGVMAAQEPLVLDSSRRSIYDFVDLFVPAGRVLRLRAVGHPLQVRACGSVRIDGRLIVEADRAGVAPRPGAQRSFEDLARPARVLVVAAGDLIVGPSGVVEWEGPVQPGESPMTWVGAGEVKILGRLPAGCVLATEPGRPVRSVSGEFVRVTVPLTHGVAPGADLYARAWTKWYRLPSTHRGAGSVRLVGASGPLEVRVQLVPPDPLDPLRPLASAVRSTASLPASARLSLEPGWFVRFRLAAPVRFGEPLASLDDLAIALSY